LSKDEEQQKTKTDRVQILESAISTCDKEKKKGDSRVVVIEPPYDKTNAIDQDVSWQRRRRAHLDRSNTGWKVL
jgi:tRNA1(Val) A37 N6-methylase TrmN6